MMELDLTPLVPTITLYAGEPIFVALNTASRLAIAESLSGRKFVMSIYDGVTRERKGTGYFNASVESSSSGDMAVWRIDGDETEALFPNQNLMWEWCERLDNGKSVIASGTLTIKESAPDIEDYDGAPEAREITLVTRLKDPGTAPVFQVRTVAYGSDDFGGIVKGSFDFTTLQNSGLVLLI